jgi:hypothetical protein
MFGKGTMLSYCKPLHLKLYYILIAFYEFIVSTLNYLCSLSFIMNILVFSVLSFFIDHVKCYIIFHP